MVHFFLFNKSAYLSKTTKAYFTYDFYIGENEVTCGEFSKTECSNDSLPVTDVSFFDAVLFANKKSKAEGLDTVYTYSSSKFDSENHCISLEGFVFHPDVFGYRLPTEAEWNTAAKLNWNPEKSWNALNSDIKPQKVCSAENAIPGFPCDMDGNVMEWVNDWLGSFSDTLLVDFVGPPDGGKHDERIVKGGSYRHAPLTVNILSRGDIYTVTSSTHTEYIGFRLALGRIKNPMWMNGNGETTSSRVVPLASISTIRTLTHASRAKLVFRNDVSGNIAFINYNEGTLSVTEIKDTLDSYHPDISPDGKKVAFCTNIEGLTGPSAVYVRDLDSEGSNLIKLDVKNASIPRWTITSTGDTAIIYVTSAENNKGEADFKQQSTWQVIFSKGKFGSPKKILDGSFHGGVSRDKNFAVTGARLLRAYLNGHDTIWYNKEQACNVSLANDESKRTLFLDFGGTTGQKFVNQKYDSHEMLLVADSTGKLEQAISSPSGYTYDHSEWINEIRTDKKEQFAVATLVNSSGEHKKIVLINLIDETITELAEGDELWHPCLWVRANENQDPSNELDLDSAGKYYSIDQVTHLLVYKMKLFWELKDSLEFVGFGNSHMQSGFNPQKFDNAMNMATIPCDMYCNRYLFENYVLNHCPKLKYIIVSMDIDSWNTDEGKTLKENFGSAPGYIYDANHNFWKDSLYDDFLEAAQNTLIDIDEYMDLTEAFRGFGATDSIGGWFDEDGSAEIVDGAWEIGNTRADQNYDQFLEILRLAKDRGIFVIGLTYPTSPYYRNTDFYGRHGMNRIYAEQIIERLKHLDDMEKYFVFMDENKMGYHDYDNFLASDYDHLNIAGADKLATRIDSVLKEIKKIRRKM